MEFNWIIIYLRQLRMFIHVPVWKSFGLKDLRGLVVQRVRN